MSCFWECGVIKDEMYCLWWVPLNTLRPRQDGGHFPDDIFKCIPLNENVWIFIKISQKFVLKGPINNIASLVQIMAWWRPGAKPLSEPMMVNLLTHICITQPQWVKFNPSSASPIHRHKLGLYSLRSHPLIGIGIPIMNLRKAVEPSLSLIISKCSVYAKLGIFYSKQILISIISNTVLLIGQHFPFCLSHICEDSCCDVTRTLPLIEIKVVTTSTCS